ncbi:indolepyruvate ferredoxin oxidoreductase family protein [Mycobacterium triplex]|uniref:Indolepyruvate ferredoxin oxidoreductase n=1 Tax=Mycobacterium triplex TaxID=47839 RepID=A0A024JRA3_9MYCO|nr:indolepyruvate ferredoxin oxidoreductase family protein [Mycobacterium triplex]CDO86141.1 indolepyruvate ferredoxin oxidoreductase [Mycobacterium triplex]
MPTSKRALDDKYLLSDGQSFMTGIQALVRLPLQQQRRDGCDGRTTATFISGYQGSPLGTYDMELERARKILDEHHIVFQPGLNEELAATAVMGSQLINEVGQQRFDGVCGIWYGKAPGVDRASDALRHANLVGVPPTGGAIVLAGDDPSAKSSTLPCASETALFDVGIPFLFPADVQEVLDFGVHAFALSRCSGLWAGMKIVTNVADGSATVNLASDRVQPQMVQIEDNGRPITHQPNAILIGAQLEELERTQWNARLDAARRYIAVNGLNQIVADAPGAKVGIVAPGKSYVDVIEALHRMGLDGNAIGEAGIRLLKVGAPFPMDPMIVREFASGLREIIVIEEKRAFVELFVKDALYGTPDQPRIVGKHDERGAVLMPINGEGSPDLIARILAPRLCGAGGTPLKYEGEHTRIPLPLIASHTQSPARTPYFCSGCPHNTSTKVPEGSVVGAGIGCHGLVMIMDAKQVGNIIGVTQMGGEGAQWIGLAPFTEVPHLIQDIGDGTFMHSGSLAIRAAVAAGVNITYKLLYNSAVAMTGGQAPVGALSVQGIVELLLAEGVQKVIVTTEDTTRYRKVKLPRGVKVLDRSRLLEAEQQLAKIPGVTVLLHDQECAAEKRRKRKRGKMDDPATRIFINERICEGCGDCGEKSNCLSVEPVDTDFGRKTKINQSSCNKDYACVNGDCPSFVEVIPSGRKLAAKIEPLAPDDFSAPQRLSENTDFSMRITGIGGTGVVTLAQVLATAATLDGWIVRGLDQTGMAQKGGPVVSDLRFTCTDQIRANKLASDDCDLYLGCDVLVAAAEGNLRVADPQRTFGVVSSAVVPTGAMVVNTQVSFPDLTELQARIAKRMRPNSFHLVDARSLTESLFGSSQTENMLLVGVAFQAGALPLTAESIEKAITLNGVAVEANLQAFRRGRQVVAAPEQLADTAGKRWRSARAALRGKRHARADAVLARIASQPNSELERVMNVLVPELIAYQNVRYARRYASLVERIRARESEVTASGGDALASAVGRNLFKLMAYKDEAEVARLSIDGQLQAALDEEFGPGARIVYKLHPPALRALGVDRKVALGPWFKPAFHALYLMRHLRGTPLNPFGLGKVRRLERELIKEYIHVLTEIDQHLTTANHATAVEIAELPDMVRGYEDIKMRNVAKYRERLAELLAQLMASSDPATAVKAGRA